jgi:hypothetical protein
MDVNNLDARVDDRIKEFSSVEQSVIINVMSSVIGNLQHPMLQMIDNPKRLFEVLHAVSDLFAISIEESEDAYNRSLKQTGHGNLSDGGMESKPKADSTGSI